MISSFINFIKNQKSNLLICLCVFLFSSYFNYVNSVSIQQTLITKKHTDINQLLNFHIMFMKRISQDSSWDESFKKKSLLELVDTIKHDTSIKNSLGFASTWLTLFNNYLLTNDDTSVLDYTVMKHNYQLLLSAIIRYNLEVNRYHTLISNKLLSKIPFTAPTQHFRLINNSVINLNGFEIIH
tara:strand:- start:1466 stop:2014 length:549 start_codon:yes stop_codon:yes gene_type:complete